MRLNFFFQNVQNFMEILKLQLNIEKKSLVFKINAFELVALSSPYYGENTWHRQSMVDKHW